MCGESRESGVVTCRPNMYIHDMVVECAQTMTILVNTLAISCVKFTNFTRPNLFFMLGFRVVNPTANV